MNDAQIYALLGNLCEGRVFPAVAPQGTKQPWVIFTLPSETGDDVFCGQSGFTATTLQVDVYAKVIDEATALRDRVELALVPLLPTSLLKTKGYETDTGLHRATIEVLV